MIIHNWNNGSIKISENRIESLIINGKELAAGKLPLFKIALRGDEPSYVTANDGIISSISENKYCITYKETNLTVRVFVTLTEKGLSWDIEIDNNTGLMVEWVDFPQIVVPNDLNGGENKILWGFNEGVEVNDIAFREKLGFPYQEPVYPCVGTMGIFPAIVETQFMAYYNEAGGLYFGAHDREGNIKGIDFYPVSDGIKLQFRLFSGASDYSLVMESFSGDWHEAADIYRSWFESALPVGFVEIEKQEALPSWYERSPVIVAYPVRGDHDMDIMNPNKLFPYINAMPRIKELSAELSSPIMALVMHWEGTAPWAPPYVWPPYGGEEALCEFANALHEEGHLLGVYCSGIGWTEQSNLIKEYNTKKQFEMENLASVMCISPEGTLPPSRICTGQRSGYDMCPSQEFTQNVIADQVEKMVNADIDYIQVLDQNHGGTPYFCYSKEHGHPPVPGKWQSEAMIKLLKKINLIAKDKKVLFGCESAAAETYIPYLLFNDNRYNINYEVGTPVPVYSYIYHKYINNFMGNQVCANHIFDHEKSPENIFYRYAYSFIAGDMLTLVINQNGEIAWNWSDTTSKNLPNQGDVIKFVENCNSWRRGIGKKYLYTGKMQKPYKIDSGEKSEIHLSKGDVHMAEKLLTSRYLAEDGTTAQFVTNYNNYDVVFKIFIDDTAKITVYSDPEAYEKILINGSAEFTVKPLSSIMIITT